MAEKIFSKADLVGTWKLVDFKSVDLEQKVRYPYGQNPIGYIVYTEEGRMSVSIQARKRLNFGLSTAQLQEFKNAKFGIRSIANIPKYIKLALRILKAAQTHLSYSGTYEVRDNKVIHHVELSLIPDWTGTDLERAIESAGENLVLSNTVDGVYYTVIWQPVQEVG